MMMIMEMIINNQELEEILYLFHQKIM